MRSIIDQPKTEAMNFRTLNFIVIGLGDSAEMKKMLAYLRKSLSDRSVEDRISLYSEYTLSRAESDPELLLKKGSLSFRMTGNLCKDYVGFADVTDHHKLYSYLFDPCPNPSGMRENRPYYTPARLSEVIHDRFDSEDYDSEETFGDVVIRVTHMLQSDGRSYLKVEYRVNELVVGNAFARYLNWFDALIHQMDADYSGCFQSAYISFNYPGMPIVHERVYDHMDVECLDRHILGTEWRVYLSGGIASRLHNDALDSIGDVVSVRALKNGIDYTANTDIASFDGVLRKKISCALKDVLVPAYGIYHWRGLYEQFWSVSYLPQAIYAYRDKYDIVSPTVILAYHYPVEKMQALDNLSGLDLMGAWFLSNND